MLDDKTIKKLLTPRKQTKNIISLDVPDLTIEDKTLMIACPELRAMAQNLIENIEEHRHLRSANILLLVKTDTKTADKIYSGAVVEYGKAAKANPIVKLVCGRAAADFIITLSGDILDFLGCTTSGGKSWAGGAGGDEKEKDALAMLDHEMLHCGAKTHGIFIERSDLKKAIEDLGTKYIETCEDIVRESDDAVLVRYYLVKERGYEFCSRKHDIQEFRGVIQRWGMWTNMLKCFAGAITEEEPLLK
jgi:hypothetical protein